MILQASNSQKGNADPEIINTKPTKITNPKNKEHDQNSGNFQFFTAQRKQIKTRSLVVQNVGSLKLKRKN